MEMDPKRNAEHYPDPTAYQAIRNAEPARFSFRPLVYVCSPYAGDVEANTARARRYCRYVTDQGGIPLAPHLYLPQFLDEKTERDLALSWISPFCPSVRNFGFSAISSRTGCRKKSSTPGAKESPSGILRRFKDHGIYPLYGCSYGSRSQLPLSGTAENQLRRRSWSSGYV